MIAQQWEFTYRYPSYGGLETPQLVLPANTLIGLHVTSLDVVHSFWAYQLGVKADANPGVDNVVYVQTEGAAHVRTSTAPSSAGSGTATCSTPARSSARRVRAWIKQAAAAASRRSRSTCRRTRTRTCPDPQRRAG